MGKANGQAVPSRPKGKAIHGRGSGARSARKSAYLDELKSLQDRLKELDPSAATPPTKFSEVPLSNATRQGLDRAFFHTCTPIQSKSLLYSLKGYDILGAARTGSGKTLSFLIPLLERLYRLKWGPNDGLGALVITPTRELAVQIFEVLRKIGPHHTFSAGLVIGGKSLKDEQERLSRMNILISTPGRLLQHMDQTIDFDTSNLQMLVLDEADRILDLGFRKTLDAIIANLPPPPSTIGGEGRQTLLFSATQTNSVQALARLSLNDPIYVSVRDDLKTVDGSADEAQAESLATKHQNAATSKAMQRLEVPQSLEQFYMIVELDRKLDMLWSFIKTHLACKILVFVSSCKQVRFIYETFRHLRPGIPLLHMHGKQKQTKRLEIYSRFTSSNASVLISTDIASRGLDFPNINWVIQVDLAENLQQYVHRIGRTARFNKKGKSLLFLMPSEEEGFLKRLEENHLSEMIKLIKPKDSKQQTIQKQFQSLSFQFTEIKFLAQKSFVSYVKSLYLQKDKEIFDLSKLDLDKYAKALGLPGAPKIKFLQSGQKNAAKIAKEAKEKKNRARQVDKLEQELPMEDADLVKAADKEALLQNTAIRAPGDQDGQDERSGESDDTDVESDSSEDPELEEPTEQLDGQPVAAGKIVPSKTTKYDKMYKRSNQGVLSEHYKKLVSHDDEAPKDSLLGGDDDQEDFIVPSKVPIHTVPEVDSTDSKDFAKLAEEYKHDVEDLSRRREKLGQTKKGLLKLRGQGSKITFDDSGVGHALYELVKEDDIGDVNAQRATFLEEERRKMGEVDLLDKAAQKAARREKKRARKEREREVNGLDKGAEGDGDEEHDDYGVQDIDFDFNDLPPTDEEDGGNAEGIAFNPKPKRKRESGSPARDDEQEDLELAALRALKKGKK